MWPQKKIDEKRPKYQAPLCWRTLARPTSCSNLLANSLSQSCCSINHNSPLSCECPPLHTLTRLLKFFFYPPSFTLSPLSTLFIYSCFYIKPHLFRESCTIRPDHLMAFPNPCAAQPESCTTLARPTPSLAQVTQILARPTPTFARVSLQLHTRTCTPPFPCSTRRIASPHRMNRMKEWRFWCHGVTVLVSLSLMD